MGVVGANDSDSDYIILSVASVLSNHRRIPVRPRQHPFRPWACVWSLDLLPVLFNTHTNLKENRTAAMKQKFTSIPDQGKLQRPTCLFSELQVLVA